MSVGCVSIGDSSLQEISQFTSDGSENHDADRSNQRGVDPVMSAVDDYDLYTEQLEECSVVFDVVNPRSPAYKTVVIRNYWYLNDSLVHNVYTWLLGTTPGDQLAQCSKHRYPYAIMYAHHSCTIVGCLPAIDEQFKCVIDGFGMFHESIPA